MHLAKRIALGLLAAAIALLALKTTVAFYSTYGADDDTKQTFIALAFVSLAIKLLAPSAASAFPRFHLAGIALWLGFFAAVVFDSYGVAGYVEMTYGSTTGEASRYADDYKTKGGKVDELHQKYKEYEAVRSTGEISAALDAAKGVAGKCSPRRAHLDVCIKVSDLEQELARADERDKRESEWRQVSAEFDKMKKPQIAADPQAAVAARIGRRIGFEGAADFVAPILSVLIFIFYEVVGPALMYAALEGTIKLPVPKPARGAHETPAARTNPQRRARGSSNAPATAGDIHAALLDLRSGAKNHQGVNARDGKLCGSQRTIGEALGISAATLNRHLGELRAAGTISTRTGPDGTVIEFLGAK